MHERQAMKAQARHRYFNDANYKENGGNKGYTGPFYHKNNEIFLCIFCRASKYLESDKII